jgi:HD-like signal output (HDOD) protein
MTSSSGSTQSIYNDILEDIERNRLPLPTQPKIAVAIQELSENPNVTIEELNDVIGKDPALTARIIRIANSPLVRGRVSINTLKTAISRLGTHFVANMAIGLAMEQLFNAKNKIIEEKMRQAWQHSGEVAGAAYAIANYTKSFPPEEAMLAGLLHEIGTLPILTYAEHHKSLMQNLDTLDMLIHKFRSTLGEAILSSWQFPSLIADVPKNIPNLYREIDHADLTDVVLVAKIYSLKGSQHPLSLLNKEEIPSYARLGLDPKQDLSENEDLNKQLEEVQNIFSS